VAIILWGWKSDSFPQSVYRPSEFITLTKNAARRRTPSTFLPMMSVIWKPTVTYI